jgi:hypothetical protein
LFVQDRWGRLLFRCCCPVVRKKKRNPQANNKNIHTHTHIQAQRVKIVHTTFKFKNLIHKMVDCKQLKRH